MTFGVLRLYLFKSPLPRAYFEMLDLKNLNRAVEAIAKEKGLEKEAVLSALESALAAAYRREYGKKGELVRANLDVKTGEMSFLQIKTVVDEGTVRFKEIEKERAEKKELEGEALPIYNPDRHILLDEAKKIKPDAQVGDEIEFQLEEHQDFGRIASQAAKQVILQKLREVERDSVKKEYQGKEGEIVSGVVQRTERGNVYIDLGRAQGVMFWNEAIPGEHYKAGERLRFYLLAVQEESRLPGVILSRAHPKFVSKLFEIEVPEIHDGLVEIKAIAREPGNRTKIAVASKSEEIDPIGALVGQRGVRVMAVNNELGNEKIDVVEYSDEPEKFIAQALSPAKVQRVEVMPRREVKVFVPENQLSLAIGKGGQNVRLAAKLTGWKIDVRSESRPEVPQEGGVAEAPEAKNPQFDEDKNIGGNKD